jgi:hypothetical protein
LAERAARVNQIERRVGQPGRHGLHEAVVDYIAVQLDEWARRGETPDLLLVAGRFCVASALSGLLACPAAPPRLMMHDMVEKRLHGYGAVLVAAAAQYLSAPSAKGGVMPGALRLGWSGIRCAAGRLNMLRPWRG